MRWFLFYFLLIIFTYQTSSAEAKTVKVAVSLGGVQCDFSEKCYRFYNYFSEVVIALHPGQEASDPQWAGENIQSFDVDGVTFKFITRYLESSIFEQKQVRLQGMVVNSLHPDQGHESSIFISHLEQMPIFMITGEKVTTSHGTVTPMMVFSPLLPQPK